MTSKVFLNTVLTIGSLAATAAAQSAPPAAESSSDKMLYILAFISIVGVILSYYFWRRSKLGNQPDLSYGNRYQDYHSKATKASSVDADEELEWLRKVKTSTTNADPKMTFKKRANTPRRRTEITATNSAGIDESTMDTKVFQEKMRRVQYAQLPINAFTELAPAKKYEPLPLSEDDALLDAIEQANEEFEEDVAVRDLALKILAMFRNKNSIEALSQIALYDLAAPLRSKAVTALTEFDHESVFEAILLACADPTREVRAAAARGLFRLNFDRADAWKRIIETRDGFRMRHAARAALEAGIVAKAFDRLIHDDMKIAYEAIVLVSLMIKAGETREIFDAIRNHKDERVRFALVHVLKVIHDDRTQEDFQQLAADESLSAEVKTRVMEALPVFEAVAA
jgi:hypothetical protein